LARELKINSNPRPITLIGGCPGCFIFEKNPTKPFNRFPAKPKMVTDTYSTAKNFLKKEDLE